MLKFLNILILPIVVLLLAIVRGKKYAIIKSLVLQSITSTLGIQAEKEKVFLRNTIIKKKPNNDKYTNLINLEDVV